MTLFYILILLIMLGVGAIAWILIQEKKKENPNQPQKSAKPELEPKDLLGRLGLESPKTPTSITLPEIFKKVTLTKNPEGQSTPNSMVTSPKQPIVPPPASTQIESEISLKYDELLASNMELKAQYAKLEALFAEKSLNLEKSEKNLNNELKNQKEFNKVKDILEKELKESKDRLRQFQGDLSTAETDTQTQLKRVSQLEEKVKNLEGDILVAEGAINDAQASTQLARKRVAELEEKLRVNELQILEKNQKIEDLVLRLKDAPRTGTMLPQSSPLDPIPASSENIIISEEEDVVEKGGGTEELKRPPTLLDELEKPLEEAGEEEPLPLSPKEKANLEKSPELIPNKPLTDEPIVSENPKPSLSVDEKPTLKPEKTPDGAMTLPPDILSKPAPPPINPPSIDSPEVEPKEKP